MSLPKIDETYFINFLVDLLNIPSPTGFAEPAIAFVEKELSKYKQLELSRTRKGALVAKWSVESNLPPVALTAHVDTLGAVVKEIKPNGRLKLSAPSAVRAKPGLSGRLVPAGSCTRARLPVSAQKGCANHCSTSG